MLVKVSRIEANPFRRLDHYKIIQEKVDELKNSINETTFWGGLLARENPNKKGFYQLAFGHHRIEAIRQLEIKEIDIQIRDIDDSLLLRMMANENLDTWKTTPAVINETVWAAKDFIEKEIKNKSYEQIRANKSISSLFDDEKGFRSAKGQGIGQPVLLRFLGDNWKQWMIQEALSTIQDSEDREVIDKTTKKKVIKKATIDREAVEEFPTTKQATTFKRAVQTYEVPKHKQKELAKEIIKEGRDSTREIKDAVKEKAIESKKSRALTKTDQHKIERDAELEELKDLIEETAKSINSTNSKITKLLSKLNEMKVSSLSGLEITENDIYCGILIDTLIEFSPYLSFNISKEEK